MAGLFKAKIVCEVPGCSKTITSDSKSQRDAVFAVRRIYHAHLQTHGYRFSEAQVMTAMRDVQLEEAKI